MLTWANRLTFFRLFATPVFAGLLLHYREKVEDGCKDSSLDNLLLASIILFTLAIISDGVDGFLARVFNQKTLLGTILDPIADKLLLMTATIILSLPIGLKYKIPSWLAVSIISRDIIILAGALVVYLVVGKAKFLPCYLGKITTFLQMSTIFLVLLQTPVCEAFFYLTLVFTVLSGLSYVYRETRFANSNGNAKVVSAGIDTINK